MKNRRRRNNAWLARWEQPAVFPALRLPAADGRPYPPPKIRTPQPDLWRLPPRRPQRRRCC